MAIRTINTILRASDLPTDWLFEYLLDLKTPLQGLDQKIRSPFSRDTNASFSIYKTEEGPYRFKCFSTGIKGNPFDLFVALEKKAGREISYKEATTRLTEAFKNGEGVIARSVSKEPGIILNTKAKVTAWEMNRWDKEHLAFWSQFDISQDILEEYNVCVLKKFVMHKLLEGVEKEYIFENKMQFGYCRKDGSLHKIYKPGTKPKAIKVGSGYLEGEDQCLKPKENLLITKSTKDIMGFRGLEIDGWDAVSCDSENVIISKKVIEEKKAIYKRITVLFDNDQAGELAGLEYQNRYGIVPIKLDMPGKDITDNIRDYSGTVTRLKLMQLL